MPKGEVPHCAVNDEDEGLAEISKLDFHPPAQTCLTKISERYTTRLTQQARACAQHDEVDIVSAVHVEHAEQILRKSVPAELNPQVLWLISGVLIAISLAIPDAGSMYLGSFENESPHVLWGWLKFAFATFLFLGISTSVLSFLLALGPDRPKWIDASWKALSKVARKK